MKVALPEPSMSCCLAWLGGVHIRSILPAAMPGTRAYVVRCSPVARRDTEDNHGRTKGLVDRVRQSYQ